MLCTHFQVTQPRLKTYSLSQLTLLAWGLAKWGSTPPANWLAAYFKRWRACTEALDKSAAEPDALEQSAAEADALADASLSLPLSAPAAMANASVKAGTGVGVLVERVLSQALWSWAELRLAPPHSVLRRMASEVLVSKEE